MKNLSLFVTLGLVTLMGACNAVNSGTPTDSSVILESTEGTTAEGINIEVEEPNLEAQAQGIPGVDGSTEGKLEDPTIGEVEAPELEANEISPDSNPDVIIPETNSAEISNTDEKATEPFEPAAEAVE